MLFFILITYVCSNISSTDLPAESFVLCLLGCGVACCVVHVVVVEMVAFCFCGCILIYVKPTAMIEYRWGLTHI